MKKIILILTLTILSCEEPKAPTQSQPASQDQTAAASSDTTKPVIIKPLTLKEKLSVAAKQFEPLQTSFEPFCPKTPKDLNLFYTTLLYEMARHESGFKNNTEYYECSKTKCMYSAGCWNSPERGFCRITSSKLDGGYAVSRGLFQMSLSSSRGLGCLWLNSKEDLFNEDLNIKCATHVLKNYIVQDNQIAGRGADGKWKGASRYWSVTRNTFGIEPRKSFYNIKAQLQKLEGCK